MIKYATTVPEDANSHDVANKFPYVAADLLTTNASLRKAIIDGGREIKKEDSQNDSRDDDETFGGGDQKTKGGYSQVKIKFA